MNALADLPDAVLGHILQFLPQQALINLALTNYRFYTPCLQQLYSNIAIQCTPTLGDFRSQQAAKTARKIDFLDSSQTTIYGLKNDPANNKIYSVSTHLKLLGTRLAILVQSLEVNSELKSYINSITVRNEAGLGEDPAILKSLRRLLVLLKGQEMDRVYIEDEKLRKVLDVNSCGIQLRSVVFDTCIDIGAVKTGVDEILLNVKRSDRLGKVGPILANLRSLILPADDEIYWNFMKQVAQKGITFFQLEKFRVVLNSSPSEVDWNAELSRRINWKTIKELEIVVGSPPDANDGNDDLVLDLLNSIPSSQLLGLRRLSIVQKYEYATHKKNEFFDINVFTFLDQIIQAQTEAEKAALGYLCITHNLPNLGNFIDGFEGNYLRRNKLYGEALPRILAKSPRNIELVLPNFFQTLACYEQPMNTMLWNGCKCAHCEKHLGLLDQYLLYHKYHSNKYQAWRDINTSLIMFTIGHALRERMGDPSDPLATQLEHGKVPLRDVLWNYHDSTFNIPFRCYDTQVVDHGEFDESSDQQNDEFFDSSETIVPCSYNRATYAGVPVCISHYLNNFIVQTINLNRGNAEEEVIGEELKDGGDDEVVKLRISRFTINGICYNLDKELNGTNFFVNVYDDVHGSV